MLAIGAQAHRAQAACAVALRDAHRLRCDSAMRLRVAALRQVRVEPVKVQEPARVSQTRR